MSYTVTVNLDRIDNKAKDRSSPIPLRTVTPNYPGVAITDDGAVSLADDTGATDDLGFLREYCCPTNSCPTKTCDRPCQRWECLPSID